jgi:hypothetical protein
MLLRDNANKRILCMYFYFFSVVWKITVDQTINHTFISLLFYMVDMLVLINFLSKRLFIN